MSVQLGAVVNSPMPACPKPVSHHGLGILTSRTPLRLQTLFLQPGFDSGKSCGDTGDGNWPTCSGGTWRVSGKPCGQQATALLPKTSRVQLGQKHSFRHLSALSQQ